MNKYTFNVRWSDEDTCYVAVSSEFAGLSGLGDTAEDALAELQVVLAAAIEMYQQEGWPLPKPNSQPSYSGKLLVRMPKSLHARLVEHAEMEDISLNTYIVTLLGEAIGLSRTQA